MREAGTLSRTRWGAVLAFIVLALLVLLAAPSLLRVVAAPATDQTVIQPGAMPREVSLEQGVAMRDAGAFVLDVRTPAEWAEYHVPGSTLIPLNELDARVREIPAGRDVLVVCRSGNRSAQGRDVLRAAGYDRATSLAGGLSAWRARGYPTVSGS